MFLRIYVNLKTGYALLVALFFWLLGLGIFSYCYHASVFWFILLFHIIQQEYYSYDATYRNWLKIELDNAAVPPAELSSEEKERAIAAARETLKSSSCLLLSKFTS